MSDVEVPDEEPEVPAEEEPSFPEEDSGELETRTTYEEVETD